MLVGGPYLVRNATITRNGELALRGDVNASTPLTVIAPHEVHVISWNGKRVHVASNEGAILRTERLLFDDKETSIRVPKLTGWRYADSLPEIQIGFSDADWVVADHTTTNLSAPPIYGDGRVLYSVYLQSTTPNP